MLDFFIIMSPAIGMLWFWELRRKRRTEQKQFLFGWSAIRGVRAKDAGSIWSHTLPDTLKHLLRLQMSEYVNEKLIVETGLVTTNQYAQAC